MTEITAGEASTLAWVSLGVRGVFHTQLRVGAKRSHPMVRTLAPGAPLLFYGLGVICYDIMWDKTPKEKLPWLCG